MARQHLAIAGHVAGMVVTSALISPLSVCWRLRGAWQSRGVCF